MKEASSSVSLDFRSLTDATAQKYLIFSLIFFKEIHVHQFSLARDDIESD